MKHFFTYTTQLSMMEMNIFFPYCTVLQTLFIHFAIPLKCPPGTFLYSIAHIGEEFCIECQDGSFMSPSNHQQTWCRPCEKIKEPDLEILISPCNKTHGAVIHCVDGYYRDEARNPRETGTCRKCSECPEFIGRPCGTYKNTICCWDENYDVAPMNPYGVLVCRERPWFCRRGQYFETRGFQCLPCPVNTFMPLDYHTQPKCWKCREYHKNDSYRPLHSVIMQPCNSTHAPVIRCEDGFFINSYMGYRDDATGCSLCTDCSTKTDVQYEGRKCDGMEDTVCCPQSNMTVIDTPNGPVCEAPLRENPTGICGEGQCYHQSRTKRSTDCAPCPFDTHAHHSDNTGVRPENTGESTTVNPSAKETLSINDDHKSSGELIPVYVFVGVMIGLVISLVCYLIYRKVYRNRLQRQQVYCKQSQSYMDEEIKSAGLHERDPLTRTSNAGARRRKVEISSGETKERRNRLIGSSLAQVTTDRKGRAQCCGNESDLHSKKQLCENVKHHESFISAKSFQVDDLPEHFRDNGKLSYIKAVCDLTVRLKVNHTSNERPDSYPCSELRGFAGAGIKRFGTGFVFEVTKKFEENNFGTCPCKACSVYYDDAKEQWAEFAVVTAAHVVYDDQECAQTSCKLWFDHDEDFIKSRSLNGLSVKGTSNKSDFLIMHCITHDPEVSHNLEGKIAHLKDLHERYGRKSETDLEGDKKAVLISHQHGLSKKLSVGKAIVETHGETQKLSYDVQICPGSSGAPVCILGKGKGSGVQTTIHSMENESTKFYLDQHINV